MKGSYFAVSPLGFIFVGKRTQTAYTEIRYLKSAMNYAGVKDKSQYKFYRTVISNGVPVTEHLEQK